jgi:hypothetical protein
MTKDETNKVFDISSEQFACYYLQRFRDIKKNFQRRSGGGEMEHTSKLYSMNSWMKTGADANFLKGTVAPD